jgi:hypothetical protein
LRASSHSRKVIKEAVVSAQENPIVRFDEGVLSAGYNASNGPKNGRKPNVFVEDFYN